MDRHSGEGRNPVAARTPSIEFATQLGSGLRRNDAVGFIELPSKLTPLSLRLPEGYAFYAVYPEAYLVAARALAIDGPVRVVGIRSIGTSLGHIVAAAYAAPPPITVRPVGYPFDRWVEFDAAVLGPPSTTYIVVDEGPGLSGSSMVAVVDALECLGVDRTSIVLMPSHGNGPGHVANPHHRSVWAEVRVAPATADIVETRLAGWIETLLGSLDEPLRDISGGAWRALRYAKKADWPAVDPARERRKFLATIGGERWLARFAGLGDDGAAKLTRAQALHAAGLVPEARGLVHGFLVERWIDAPAPSGSPIAAIATYLGARAAFPASAGASLAGLVDMANHNAVEALGSRATLDISQSDLAMLQADVVPVAIDGRCQRHEWLDLGDSRLLKADAHDHARAHDLIGGQDIAWDVAGAAIEFDVDVEDLGFRVGKAAGRVLCPKLIDLLTPCYLAFRLGEHTVAADALGEWPAEAARNRRASEAYAARLDATLGKRVHRQ